MSGVPPNADETPPNIIASPREIVSIDKRRQDGEKDEIECLKIFLPQSYANIKIQIPQRTCNNCMNETPIYIQNLVLPPQPPTHELPQVLNDEKMEEVEEPQIDNIFDPDSFLSMQFEVQIPRITEENHSFLVKTNKNKNVVENKKEIEVIEKKKNSVDSDTIKKPSQTSTEFVARIIPSKGKNTRHNKKVIINPALKLLTTPNSSTLNSATSIGSTTSKQTTTTITDTKDQTKPNVSVSSPVSLAQTTTSNKAQSSAQKDVSFSLANVQNSTSKVPFPASSSFLSSATKLGPENKMATKRILLQAIPPVPQAIHQIQTVIEKSALQYPQLPSAADILTLINEVDEEIRKLKDTITDLNQEIAMIKIGVPPCENIKSEFEIQNFHGLFIPYRKVKDFKEQNAEKIANSHSKNLLESGTVVTHISQLPNYCEEIQKKDKISQPMMHVIMHNKTLVKEKKIQLANDYKKRNITWLKNDLQLTAYQNEMHECIDVWPPEFALNKRKTLDRTLLLPLCAIDQPMLIDEAEKESCLYYDENSFVSDALAEHIKYKQRVSWTDAEKRIFLDKYAQHPHEFKKIAVGLPSKTVKDIVEFYYINRVKLNLKEIENSSRTRGRKRVFTEGPMK